MSGALATSAGFGRKASRDLARVGLTLAPKRKRGKAAVAVAVAFAGAFAGGWAAGELLRETPTVAMRAPVAPAPDLAPLRLQLEQARMGLRVADARSHELERQIEALNQKLTETQDELTFFRKAREGKKH